MLLKKLHTLLTRMRLTHVLLLASALRLGWYLLVLFTHPEGFWLYDSNEYWNIAYNLHEYGVFSRSAEPPLLPDYFRTPLYPLFIYPTVLFDASGNSIPLLQLAADITTCWLLYKIVLRLTASEVYARGAALVYAFHFPSLVMTSFVLSESLLLLLLTWFVWTFIQCLDRFTVAGMLLAGLAGGLCVMCKPLAFVLVFPSVLFILLIKKTSLRTLGMCLCFASAFYAVQFPWMYRNKQLYGHYFNSILGEHLLFGYHTCHVYAKANGLDYFDAKEMLLDRFYSNISFNPYEKPYEYAKLIERESYNILWQHRGLFAREHLKECVKFFVQPLRGYTVFQLGNKPYTGFVTVFTVVWQVLELALLYLAILYSLLLVLLKKRKFHPVMYFLLLLLVICCQFNTMPYTDARIRFPFDGIIIVLAVVSFYVARRKTIAYE